MEDMVNLYAVSQWLSAAFFHGVKKPKQCHQGSGITKKHPVM
jgi:hypothetical protein